MPKVVRQVLSLPQGRGRNLAVRKKLAHHGKRSFSGKETKKEVAEAKLKARGMEVPACEAPYVNEAAMALDR